MDIYSAESYMKKLLEYVTEVNEVKPNMYQKSKDRLKDLAVTCNQVVRIISEILQDEALAQIDNEFRESNQNEICNMITSMESQIAALKTFVSYDSEESSNVTISKSKISPQTRRQVLTNYGKVFSRLSQSDTGNVIVDDCITLLWTWFDERFFQTPRSHPEFRYNIRRIPNWISDIVLSYSLSIMRGDRESFVDEFNEWCTTLNITEAGDKYAIPYFIYKVKQDAEDQLVDCTPVVLWDMLIDAGLHSLCGQDPSELYIQEDMMYQRCGNINPSCLDDYINYKEDDNILKSCNLLGEGQL